MSEIRRTIEDEAIEWDMDGKMQFEAEPALALLLANDVVFLNSYWMEEEWPKAAKDAINIIVNCNDVFAWGCADGERLPYDELENLYKMWKKDPAWGAAIWCMIQRKQMPQKPVEERVRKAGIWDLDKLGLGPNTMDADVTASLRALLAKK